MKPYEIDALFSGEGWSISPRNRLYHRVICFRGFRVAEGFHHWLDYLGEEGMLLYPPGGAFNMDIDCKDASDYSQAELIDVIRGYVKERRDKCYTRNKRLADLADAAMEALDDLNRYGPQPRQLGTCRECRTPRERGHNYCPGCGHRHKRRS